MHCYEVIQSHHLVIQSVPYLASHVISHLNLLLISETVLLTRLAGSQMPPLASKLLFKVVLRCCWHRRKEMQSDCLS